MCFDLHYVTVFCSTAWCSERTSDSTRIGMNFSVVTICSLSECIPQCIRVFVLVSALLYLELVHMLIMH